MVQTYSLKTKSFNPAKRHTFKVANQKTNNHQQQTLKLKSPKNSFKKDAPSDIDSYCASVAQEKDANRL